MKNLDWIIDSGATSHMCNSAAMFSSYCKADSKIKLGDLSSLKVSGKGDVQLSLHMRGGGQDTKRLKDVLCVPDLSKNLLSVSKATDHGMSFLFMEVTHVPFKRMDN